MAAIGERIYVTGYERPTIAGRSLAVRLFATGDLDATYGTAGAVIVADSRFAGPATILPDGRIAYADRSSAATASIWLGVVAADGRSRQIAPTLHFVEGSGSAPQSVPAAIVAGANRVLGIVGESRLSETTGANFGALKRTLALVPVTAFAGGARTLDFGLGDANETARAVVVDPAGRTVVLGKVDDAVNPVRLGFARFLANGSLDPGFGAGGLVLVDVPGLFDVERFAIAGLAIDHQGRIVYAGTYDTDSTLRGLDMFVGRLTTSGAVDASFGIPSTGRTGVGFNNYPGATDLANALLVQPDDAILVAGAADASQAINFNFAIARLTPDGSLDPTFGVGGRMQEGFSPTSEQSAVYAMALDARNRLLVVGENRGGVGSGIGIARITTGLPPPDPVFADEFE